MINWVYFPSAEGLATHCITFMHEGLYINVKITRYSKRIARGDYITMNKDYTKKKRT